MSDEALAEIRAARLIQQMRQRLQEKATLEAPCEDCPPEEEPVTAASPNDVIISGPATLLGEPSGDGRMIRQGALTWDLDGASVPIIWDPVDGDHSGVTLGKVDLFQDEGAALMAQARLFEFEDPETQALVTRVASLINEQAIGWSVMIDDEEVVATFREPEVTETDGVTQVRFRSDDQMFETVSGRVRHLALVDTPAFPGARPTLGPLPINAAVSLLAPYPAAHFERWESADLVPFQVTTDGRVFGHAAGDGCYRNGSKATCDRYRADPDPLMRNFHTGTVTLDNGNAIRVGALTCAGLHASISMTLAQQRQHHENSSTVWARVVAWNDRKGRLCLSGSVVPGLDPDFLAQVAGLPVSVETWPVPGVTGLTLVGAHTVVTPAWPVN